MRVVTDDANDVEYTSTQLIIVGSVFDSIATLAVIARLYARRIKRVSYGADDLMVVLVLLMAWVNFGIAVHAVQLGLGQHIQYVNPPTNIETIRFLFFFVPIIYTLTMIGYKASVLLLYRRIFACHQVFIRVVYGVGAFLVAYGIAIMFAGHIFECTPISAAWTLNGHCVDAKASAIAFSVLNITTAATILVMPIPLVWRLKLPSGQRITLGLIFLLGLFDVVATVTRLSVSVFISTSFDFTYTSVPITIWSTIEVSVGITCGCLPLLRPVVLAIVPQSIQKLFSSPIPQRRSTSKQQAWPFRSTYGHIVAPLGVNSTNEWAHNNRLALDLMTPQQTDTPLADAAPHHDIGPEMQQKLQYYLSTASADCEV